MQRNDLTLGGLEPPYWCEPLLRQFGTNPYGENVFRIVWAPRRLLLYGGYWNDKGVFEYRRVQKYGQHRVWMMERWIPARHYGSPQTWADETAKEGYLSIGPYPQFGVFECIELFESPAGGYMPLTPDIVELTARTRWCHRVRKTWDIRTAILQEEAAKDRLQDEQFNKLWDETHGVRRGVSFTKDGVLQNNNADVAAKHELILANDPQLQKEEFQAGFSQTDGLLSFEE